MARKQIRPGYIAQMMGGTFAIKIGMATNVTSRIWSLNGASPYQIRLVAVVKDGPKLEKEANEILETDWIKHEWYRPSFRLLDYIRQLIAEGRLLDEAVINFPNLAILNERGYTLDSVHPLAARKPRVAFLASHRRAA